MLRVFLVKPYKFFCCYLGPSLKASHPTEVSLRVEADARPIKNDKTEREQTAAVAASNKTEKHRKVSMAPLNKTKTRGGEEKKVLPPSHSKNLAGNTVRAMPHRYGKGGRSETKAVKAAIGVSHIGEKAVSRKALKGGHSSTARAARPRASTSRTARSRSVMSRAEKSPTARSLAATLPAATSRTTTSRAVMSRALMSLAVTSHTATSRHKISTRKAKSDLRAVQTSSISGARKELKDKGSKITASRRRKSTTTVARNVSFPHPSSNQSTSKELMRSPNPMFVGKLSASAATTPSTSHSLKKSSLSKVKTEDLIQARSRAVTITMEQKVPTQRTAQGRGTEHLIQLKQGESPFRLSTFFTLSN